MLTLRLCVRSGTPLKTPEDVRAVDDCRSPSASWAPASALLPRQRMASKRPFRTSSDEDSDEDSGAPDGKRPFRVSSDEDSDSPGVRLPFRNCSEDDSEEDADSLPVPAPDPASQLHRRRHPMAEKLASKTVEQLLEDVRRDTPVSKQPIALACGVQGGEGGASRIQIDNRYVLLCAITASEEAARSTDKEIRRLVKANDRAAKLAEHVHNDFHALLSNAARLVGVAEECKQLDAATAAEESVQAAIKEALGGPRGRWAVSAKLRPRVRKETIAGLRSLCGTLPDNHGEQLDCYNSAYWLLHVWNAICCGNVDLGETIAKKFGVVVNGMLGKLHRLRNQMTGEHTPFVSQTTDIQKRVRPGSQRGETSLLAEIQHTLSCAIRTHDAFGEIHLDCDAMQPRMLAERARNEKLRLQILDLDADVEAYKTYRERERHLKDELVMARARKRIETDDARRRKGRDPLLEAVFDLCRRVDGMAATAPAEPSEEDEDLELPEGMAEEFANAIADHTRDRKSSLPPPTDQMADLIPEARAIVQKQEARRLRRDFAKTRLRRIVEALGSGVDRRILSALVEAFKDQPVLSREEVQALAAHALSFCDGKPETKRPFWLPAPVRDEVAQKAKRLSTDALRAARQAALSTIAQMDDSAFVVPEVGNVQSCVDALMQKVACGTRVTAQVGCVLNDAEMPEDCRREMFYLDSLGDLDKTLWCDKDGMPEEMGTTQAAKSQMLDKLRKKLADRWRDRVKRDTEMEPACLNAEKEENFAQSDVKSIESMPSPLMYKESEWYRESRRDDTAERAKMFVSSERSLMLTEDDCSVPGSPVAWLDADRKRLNEVIEELLKAGADPSTVAVRAQEAVDAKRRPGSDVWAGKKWVRDGWGDKEPFSDHADNPTQWKLAVAFAVPAHKIKAVTSGYSRRKPLQVLRAEKLRKYWKSVAFSDPQRAVHLTVSDLLGRRHPADDEESKRLAAEAMEEITNLLTKRVRRLSAGVLGRKAHQDKNHAFRANLKTVKDNLLVRAAELANHAARVSARRKDLLTFLMDLDALWMHAGRQRPQDWWFHRFEGDDLRLVGEWAFSFLRNGISPLSARLHGAAIAYSPPRLLQGAAEAIEEERARVRALSDGDPALGDNAAWYDGCNLSAQRIYDTVKWASGTETSRGNVWTLGHSMPSGSTAGDDLSSLRFALSP